MVLYILHSTSEQSFYIEVVLTFTIIAGMLFLRNYELA